MSESVTARVYRECGVPFGGTALAYGTEDEFALLLGVLGIFAEAQQFVKTLAKQKRVRRARDLV